MELLKTLLFGALTSLAGFSVAENTHWIDSVQWKTIYDGSSADAFYFLGSSHQIDFAPDSLQGDGLLAEGWIRSHRPARMKVYEGNKDTGERYSGEIVHLSVDCVGRRMRANQVLWFDKQPTRLVVPFKLWGDESSQWRELFLNYGRFIALSPSADKNLDGLLLHFFCSPEADVQSRLKKRK